MKIIAVLFFVLFTSTVSFSQLFVNEVDIMTEDVDYIEIVGHQRGLFKNKIVITIDYGQPVPVFKTQILKDSLGNNIEFKSMVGALNFLVKNGWEYKNSYTIGSGGEYIYHYLLKRI